MLPHCFTLKVGKYPKGQNAGPVFCFVLLSSSSLYPEQAIWWRGLGVVVVGVEGRLSSLLTLHKTKQKEKKSISLPWNRLKMKSTTAEEVPESNHSNLQVTISYWGIIKLSGSFFHHINFWAIKYEATYHMLTVITKMLTTVCQHVLVLQKQLLHFACKFYAHHMTDLQFASRQERGSFAH